MPTLWRRSFAAILIVCSLAPLPAQARTHRDPAQRAAFMRANPCPATQRTRGPCPGWQVDHIQPLKCQGPDHPANMQWLTIEAHKAKTRAEARWCLRPR